MTDSLRRRRHWSATARVAPGARSWRRRQRQSDGSEAAVTEPGDVAHPLGGAPRGVDVSSPAMLFIVFGCRTRIKVTPCECAARARLEVALETRSRPLVGELQGHQQPPRSVVNCAAGRTVVVPHEPSSHVTGETDVVPLRVTLAAEDVHVSTRTALHHTTATHLACRLDW